MKRLLIMAAMAAAGTLLGACQSPTSDALVQVRVRGELPGLRQLRLRAAINGRDATPAVFPAGAVPTSDLTLPRTAALRLPPGTTGQVQVEVDALDAAGETLATRDGAHQVNAGDVITIEVCFGVCLPEAPDAGTPMVDDGGNLIDTGPMADATSPDGGTSICGDGNKQPGEECDDGPNNNDATGACTTQCRTMIVWTRIVDGPAHGADWAADVTVDRQGNVLVTGASTETNGTDIWARKYDSAGGIAWTRTYGFMSGGDDDGRSIAVNASGDVFVAGTVYSDAQRKDRWLRQWTAGGVEGWTWTQSNLAFRDEELAGVNIDSAGDIIVVGYLEETSPAGSPERLGFVRKYGSNMAERWTDKVDFGAMLSGQIRAVATDAQNNVYVTGWTETIATSVRRDLWLRKYSAAGLVEWTRTYAGAAGADDEGLGLAADATGVVVAGVTSSPSEYNILVRKWDPAGNPLWTHVHDSPASGGDIGYDVVLDPQSNVYTAGMEATDSVSGTMWLRKLSPGGTEIWTRRDRIGGLSARARGMARDPTTGQIVLAGEILMPTAQFADILIRKYAP